MTDGCAAAEEKRFVATGGGRRGRHGGAGEKADTPALLLTSKQQYAAFISNAEIHIP